MSPMAIVQPVSALPKDGRQMKLHPADLEHARFALAGKLLSVTVFAKAERSRADRGETLELSPNFGDGLKDQAAA